AVLQHEHAADALIREEAIEGVGACAAVLERGERTAAVERVHARTGFHRVRQEVRVEGRDVALALVGGPRENGARLRRRLTLARRRRFLRRRGRDGRGEDDGQDEESYGTEDYSGRWQGSNVPLGARRHSVFG